MAGVSLRAVLAALCLALVVVTAGVTITMSVLTGERTLTDTKDAGAAGLADCFAKGTENVRGIAQQLLVRTVEDMGNQVHSFFAQPAAMANFLLTYIARTHADVSTDPAWLDEHLMPIIVRLTRAGAPLGISGISYVSLPFSRQAALKGVLGTSKWGGSIATFSWLCLELTYLDCLRAATEAGVDTEVACAEEERRAYDDDIGQEGYVFRVANMRDWTTGRIGWNETHLIVDELTGEDRPSRKQCTMTEKSMLNDRTCDLQHGACVSTFESRNDPSKQLFQMAEVDQLQARVLPLHGGGGELDEANKLHWSPANTMGESISAFLYFPLAHPAGLPVMGPKVGPRIGFGFFEVRNTQITRRLRRMERPTPGSRLYSVERNPWTNVTQTITGASHGNSWNMQKEDNGVWTARPVSVYDSTDTVIREHARWVNSSGGYMAMADSQAREWRGPQAVLYWALTGEIHDDYGLSWYLCLVVPQGEVLGTINRATAEIRSRIKAKNDEVDRDGRRDFTVMMITIAVSALLLIVVGVSLAVYISQPLKVLDREMSQVAAMRLEEVDEQGGLSALSEISSMQASFLQMVRNLREYRSYMPVSCLIGADEEEEERADTVPDIISPRAPGSPTARSADGVFSAGTVRSSMSSLIRSPRARLVSPRGRRSSNAQDAAIAEKAVTGLGVGLLRKNASFLVANVRDFVLLSKCMSPAQLVEVHQKYLNSFISATNAVNGIPDLFIGDRYYASFGAVRQCSQQKVQTVKCALECCRQGDEALADVRVATGPGIVPAVSLACTSGEVICGNIGVEGMKRFCAVGVAHSLVHVAEQQNKIYRTKLLADGRVKSEAEGFVYTRLMHIVDEYKGLPHKLFEVLGLKHLVEEEWMYQLERADQDDPTADFSKAVATAHKGDLQGACALLKGDPRQTAQHDILVRRWGARLAGQHPTSA
eukprot:TRINITY_DN3858_c0_g2_i2.p1 TRINITY_DN3858_c0_g2~~TRINITY_DN3858_c0_g2_i2.p1  ORF type:complete len:963 (+),score=209.68 TRINITY_DN3858_c0_g2_i2:76-2889(+)